MKVKLLVTDERPVYNNRFASYGQPDKIETYTVAEMDGELTEAATVGFLRALANSIEGEKDMPYNEECCRDE